MAKKSEFDDIAGTDVLDLDVGHPDLEVMSKKEADRLRRETEKIEAERLEKKRQRLYKKRLRELDEEQHQKSWIVIPILLAICVGAGIILLNWG